MRLAKQTTGIIQKGMTSKITMGILPSQQQSLSNIPGTGSLDNSLIFSYCTCTKYEKQCFYYMQCFGNPVRCKLAKTCVDKCVRERCMA